MKKRIISFCLMLTLAFSMLPKLLLSANAATSMSGTCGDNLTWTLDESGTLTISGTGSMYNYGHTNSGYTVAPWYEHEKMDEILSVVVESGVTSIGNDAFLGCSNVSKISISNTVTIIGAFAFDNCRALVSIDIPESVAEIGSYAFSGCTSLKNITIPESVVVLGDGVFDCCWNLKEITFCGNAPSMFIPNSARYEYGTFWNITATAYYPNDNPTWTTEILNEYYGGNITWTPKENGSETHLFASGTGDDGISWILDANGNLTLEGSGAMEDHSPAGAGWGSWVAKNIASKADYKYNDNDIKSITISTGITDIGNAAFAWCYNVESAEIEDGVCSIGNWAFLEDRNLSSVTIPSSITTIGMMAFYNCSNLTEIYYYGSEEEWKKIEIGESNEPFVNANIHFNYSGIESEPNGAKEYNGHQYQLITEEMNWIEADEYCRSIGGHLVTITSEGENNFVNSLISKSTMIGLSDTVEEGAWAWVTGEPLTYTNWAKNEPNNQSNEDYVLMQVKGTWNDGHLDREKWPFICEWDGTTVPNKTYSVEEIERMVADYFNANYQDASNPGKYVVFHGETSVTGNKCSIVVRFQSSSNSPNTAANVLFAYVSVNMETGVMTIEGVNGDTDVQLFDPSSTGDEPVVIPERIDNLSSFNKYFVENYYDNLNAMYQYDSVAADILSNSSSFQINWNSCLSALSNKEFLDVLKFENHPEYYYQTVLFESIMQTKLNDDYWSALTSQIGQISLDAISYYVKYDANFTSYEKILKQKLNTTMTDFSIDSVQYKRLSDYYGQYCNQLKTYDTVKDIYDLTVKADGTVEDFFNALSNYACIYNTTEEIISALEYLKLHLEASTNEEDQYILTAVNNILASLDRTLNEQLVLNCLGTAKDLLWGVFWAAISDAFPGALALDIASFTIDSGLALSNVFFPTTISADSYCKLYADYAIEVVTREAFKKAYTSYSTDPSDELATITVGLYDLLGYTYAHEIEVAAVLSEQLHKDGLINGLKNLFSSKNISTYKYEQDCIKAYEAYLNEIASVKVEAQTTYGLAIGTMQPVVTVYFVNGKVAALNEVAINTGDIYHVSSGEFPLPDFVGLRIEIEGYYLDQQFNNAYKEAAINKPLALYCNLLLTKASDGTPMLFDHSTGISVSSEESMPKHTLSTSAVTSGNIYSSVERHFADSEFELYDISLLENGVQVQPSGEVTVEIPVNSDYANRKAKVYHVTANGEFEDMNATSGDGVLQFTTTHFSYFVVVYENTEFAWLIPIIIAVVVCGVGVSLFVVLKARKKKHIC